ncbi:MAG: hypothetical protein ACYDG2_19385 [Ruminiclostridium sp.]
MIGFSGIKILKEISEMYKSADINTKIVAASIDKSQELVDIAMCEKHIATLTYRQIMNICDMPKPLTDYYVDSFAKDWDGAGCFILLVIYKHTRV